MERAKTCWCSSHYEPGSAAPVSSMSRVRIASCSAPSPNGSLKSGPSVQVGAACATPAAIVTQLNTEINKALALPNVVAAIRALGAEPAAMSRADFLTHHQRERERFGGLVKDIGLKLE